MSRVIRAGVPTLESVPIRPTLGLTLALGKTSAFTLNLLFLPGFQAYGNEGEEVQRRSVLPREGWEWLRGGSCHQEGKERPRREMEGGQPEPGVAGN